MLTSKEVDKYENKGGHDIYEILYCKWLSKRKGVTLDEALSHYETVNFDYITDTEEIKELLLLLHETGNKLREVKKENNLLKTSAKRAIDTLRIHEQPDKRTETRKRMKLK